MTLLPIINGERIIELPSGKVVFIGDADIDCDGSGGNPDHDPYFQPDTTLHRNGRALNAYLERFIVVPPAIVCGVPGVVMGCQAHAVNLLNGRECTAVVGDLGPTSKIGELSVACAIALGLNGNPNYGGTSEHVIFYSLKPGQAAIVDGIRYELQPS